MEKMTNVKAINYVVENFGAELPTDVAEKLTAIKASFEKKAANRKPTKVQEANVELKEAIVEVLTAEGATVSEIMGKADALAGLSNQKVSALLKQLVDEGKAVKVVDKKKALFTAVA